MSFYEIFTVVEGSGVAVVENVFRNRVQIEKPITMDRQLPQQWAREQCHSASMDPKLSENFDWRPQFEKFRNFVVQREKEGRHFRKDAAAALPIAFSELGITAEVPVDGLGLREMLWLASIAFTCFLPSREWDKVLATSGPILRDAAMKGLPAGEVIWSVCNRHSSVAVLLHFTLGYPSGQACEPLSRCWCETGVVEFCKGSLLAAGATIKTKIPDQWPTQFKLTSKAEELQFRSRNPTHALWEAWKHPPEIRGTVVALNFFLQAVGHRSLAEGDLLGRGDHFQAILGKHPEPTIRSQLNCWRLWRVPQKLQDLFGGRFGEHVLVDLRCKSRCCGLHLRLYADARSLEDAAYKPVCAGLGGACGARSLRLVSLVGRDLDATDAEHFAPLTLENRLAFQASNAALKAGLKSSVEIADVLALLPKTPATKPTTTSGIIPTLSSESAGGVWSDAATVSSTPLPPKSEKEKFKNYKASFVRLRSLLRDNGAFFSLAKNMIGDKYKGWHINKFPPNLKAVLLGTKKTLVHGDMDEIIRLLGNVREHLLSEEGVAAREEIKEFGRSYKNGKFKKMPADDLFLYYVAVNVFPKNDTLWDDWRALTRRWSQLERVDVDDFKICYKVGNSELQRRSFDGDVEGVRAELAKAKQRGSAFLKELLDWKNRHGDTAVTIAQYFAHEYAGDNVYCIYVADYRGVIKELHEARQSLGD